ncbi:hypothetical protein GCM10023148_05870 [Actinokineospora soli]
MGTVVALAAAGVVATAQPAAATGQLGHRDVAPSSWLHTDSRTPHAAIATGDGARVGAWRDDAGQHHIGKAYFTFDLAPFSGTSVETARVRLPELAVTDCGAERATEVWAVAPERPITWADQPVEQVELPGPATAGGCVDEFLTWDAVDVVRQAVAEGRSSVTLAVRVSEEHQGDVRHGRVHRTNPRLSITYNTPPSTPTRLLVGSGAVPCAEGLVLGDDQPLAAASLSDPDGEYGLTARFAFWSVDDPATRVEHTHTVVGGQATSSFPRGMVQHGGTYAFAVRGEDGRAVSEWSRPCSFRSDRVAPDKAPTVTSPVYRRNGGPPGDGGQGVPGEFTFTANGVADVVAFEYDGIGVDHGRVAADRPGGSATVSITPTSDGPVHLFVRGVDAAGLRSPSATYDFWVKTTAPWVQTPYMPELNRPFTVVFEATQEGATTFHYRVDGGAEQTVPVEADGTNRVTMTPTDPTKERYAFTVWTTTADGARSGVTAKDVYVHFAAPWIWADPWYPVLGDTVELTFEPAARDVATYTYTVNGGDPIVVAADPDGYARVRHTADRLETFDVTVFSTSSDGIDSGTARESFPVRDGAPQVTSEDYRRGYVDGWPGKAGAFAFSSVVPDVVEYRYRFDAGAEQVVAAGPDGRASVVLTPTHPGRSTLVVRAVTRSGLVSGAGSYDFWVAGLPPELDPSSTGTVHIGTPIAVRATAVLPGSTEFLYTISGGPTQVVPVDPDGTAVIDHVAPAGTSFVRVWSRTAEGYRSSDSTVYFSGVPAP